MNKRFSYKFILVEDQLEQAKLFQVVWAEVWKDIPLMIFADGTQLLKYFLTQAQQKPHLVFLDLNLPGVSGHDCLVALRQLEITRYSPIIVFSSSESPVDIKKAYQSHATSYIQKPFDVDKLRTIIRSTIEHWSCVLPIIPSGNQSTEPFPAPSAEIPFYFQVLENLPNMVFVKEAKELRFVYFNQAGEKLLGMSKNTLLGKNDYDFFPAAQADFFTSKDRSVLDSRQPTVISKEPITTKSLGLRQLRTRKVPLFLSPHSTEPTHLLGISEDITEEEDSDS